jgi:hypothetical protein
MGYLFGFILLVLIVAVVSAAAYHHNQAKVDAGIDAIRAAAKDIQGK